jgi:hypothetical protein
MKWKYDTPKYEWLDEDGYPTDEALDEIKNWHYDKGWISLMEFVKSIWWASDWGWSEENTKDFSNGDEITYNISTGGWSGNESLISALQENQMFWLAGWYQTRRGGHYIFKLKAQDENTDDNT